MAARVKASIAARRGPIAGGAIHSGQAEEGFGPAGQRAFVGWSAHVDMGDGAMAVQMGEPGACGRSLAQHADG